LIINLNFSFWKNPVYFLIQKQRFSKSVFKAEKSSFFITAFLHFLLLFWLFFEFTNKNPHQSPTISFNVVTTEVRMEPNESLTKMISKQNKKPKKKIEEKGSEIQKDENEEPESVQQNVAISNDSAVIFDAAYLNNQAPPYPSMSKSLQEEGEVLLEVEIDAFGNVGNIKIQKSSGFKRLDSAALKAVKNWRFVAAKKNNQFVASTVQIPINFILE
jgi:TonB family protein